MIPKRRLGADGPLVGAVGLGCMSFAGAYGGAPEKDCFAILDRSAELGVTLMDTANIYGNGRSETILGAWLKANSGHPFTICTKAGIVTGPPRGTDNSAAHLRESLLGSLGRLNLDRVDLFYIHRREAARPIADIMETMVRLKEEGLIGGIGFSEIAPSTLEEAAALHPVMAVQSEYSLWTRQPELGMIDACRRLGTAFVPFSPVARGAIGDRDLEMAALDAGDFRLANPRFAGTNWEANRAALARFRDFARAKGHAPATLAIAWSMRHGDHMIPIPGTNKLAHLEQNAAAARLSLSAGDLAEIEAVLPAGFARGSRYSPLQWHSVEDYC
ncbi:MAG: aldo/keto reductase [Rhizobiaceae bacterium]|jgi:aryl-alcohol dehydrogenase-like predicted oxidoreductase|nr:aldo/keto reductase [Rhizobiaceae bacterium]